jgi:multidrug resistance efflux pump
LWLKFTAAKEGSVIIKNYLKRKGSKKMQNGKKKVLALLLAGCCVLSACGTKTDDTKTAEKGNFVTGTVECKEVYVRAKIPGYLTDIPVEEGQEVKEGDLLFSTDRRDVEVKQTQASATAKAAAGQVEAAKNAAEAAAAVVEKANANVKLLENIRSSTPWMPFLRIIWIS